MELSLPIIAIEDGSLIPQKRGGSYVEQYTLIYLYDESNSPIGMMYRTPSYSDYAFDYYFFEKNLQGDIVAIYNASGTKIGSYTYDAWGKCTATSNISGYNTILYANPFRYRGYYYDGETGYYYLQSRYYNPTWGRFLNADGYINANGDIIGFNMFAYCSNNPISRVDSNGKFWEEIGNFFSKIWNCIKTFATNTFGAGSSTTVTISENEKSIIPDPSPITVKTGTQTTQIISSRGDSSKPISVYANKNAQRPMVSSSAGIYINIGGFTLDLSVGLDNIGIYGSFANDNSTSSLGLKLDLSKLKIGIEGSEAIQWDNTTETAYTNISVSGWSIIVLYMLVTTGQYVQSPSSAH